jgi:raffinose/stachyose/melibiose transport system permease protein
LRGSPQQQRRSDDGDGEVTATTDTTTAGRALARPAVGRIARKWLTIGLYIGPAVALYAIFIIVPVAQAVHYSFYNWDGLQPLTDYIGLGNYREAFGDPAFRQAIGHNAILIALSLGLQLPLALGMALLLNRPLRGRGLLRLVFFAPYVISEAVTAIVFLQILQPDNLVDSALRAVGLGGLVHLWLADLGIVFYTLFVVITWKYIGFAIILFLAGLQGIPPELNEAAAMDGATSWTTLRYITLPLLGPTLRIWAFLAVIGSIQLFDIVWIMTLGGPAGASATMATYMIDQGVRSLRIGYATSVAVILFGICFVFSILYQIFVLRRDTSGRTSRMAG